MKTKAFIRRVGFGLKPDEQVPENALDWAKNQMNVVPKLIWPGRIYSEKEMLDIRVDFTTAEDKLQKTEKDPSKAKIKRNKFGKKMEFSVRPLPEINNLQIPQRLVMWCKK